MQAKCWNCQTEIEVRSDKEAIFAFLEERANLYAQTGYTFRNDVLKDVLRTLRAKFY